MRPEGETVELACEQAAQLIRSFVAGREVVEQRMSLRAHLAGCAECRAQYQAQVLLVARLARGTDQPPSSARVTSRARASSDGSAAWQARRSFLRPSAPRLSMAKVVLPAFALCALYALFWKPDPGVTLRALGGDVRLGSAQLAASDTARALERSNAFSTGVDGRARVESGQAAIVLEPKTALLFERAQPLRVRLFEGTVLVEGAALIATECGMLELHAGRGVVRFESGELSFVSDGDACRFVDRDGEHSIGAGVATRVSLSGAGASLSGAASRTH